MERQAVELSSVEAVLRALERGGVRYLVVGGLAVVAHGVMRATQDIDLVLDLESRNVARALDALAELGYRPLVPVALAAFADAGARRSWREQKNAVVFQLFSDEHPTARIDLFLDEPFDFDAALARAARREIADRLEVSFLGLSDLIAMKERAGRPEDLADVAKLRLLEPDAGRSPELPRER